MRKILVTGSEGAIGAVLVKTLRDRGHDVACMDISLPNDRPDHGDILDIESVRKHLCGCEGVIHLAALSRVVWGEKDPKLCWETNVTGTARVLEACEASESPCWFVLASSREVYGNNDVDLFAEDTPQNPANIYGESKKAAEEATRRGMARGVRAAILRLSNVYGGLNDHPDRVVPAFCRAAATGGEMSVHGTGNTCDFTHIDDTVDGILKAVTLLRSVDGSPPPMNLATGVGTTLETLAHLARDAGDQSAAIHLGPGQAFAVEYFVGDPRRARELLGWQPTIGIEEGVRRMVRDFRELLGKTGLHE